MQELEKSLAQYFGIREEISAKLSSLFHLETLSRNEFHTKTGSHHCKLSFVRSGFLRIYKQTDTKEVTQWISGPGEFTTDLSAIMFEKPARWNIQAITDCELLSLSLSDYQHIQEIVSEWTEIEKLFLGKCFITIEDRVFSFLSMSAEERYLAFYEFNPELFHQVPQQYLASMLGMTPETFSRIRAKIVS